MAGFDVTLIFWASLWLSAAAFVLVRHAKTGESSGLSLAYVLSFGALHWLPAVLYLLPWYETDWHESTVVGVRISACAMVGFASGAEMVSRWAPRRAMAFQSHTIDRRLPTLYLAVGAVLYSVVAPMARNIPTLNAVVNTGATLIVAGFATKCWNALGEHRAHLWLWLGLTSLLPVVTVLTQGFLGYGFAAMLPVFAFVAVNFRPRWRIVALGILVAQLGLSVYVTYMRDRAEIRRSVWGGASLDDRLDRLADTMAAFEWFDPTDDLHLRRIDDRLNQSGLVGVAALHMERESIPLARGATLRDAVLAVIPRAIWAGKTAVAGSGDLVSTYTGIDFMEGTSVGVGQVLECYINFGLLGVIIGFLIIGAVVVCVDRGAVAALARGDAGGFLIWYVPGLSLLIIGGSFVEVTSSAGAALVMALGVRWVAVRWLGTGVRPAEAPSVV